MSIAVAAARFYTLGEDFFKAGNMHCVRVREGREVLQTIELDRGCFACMLGGAARKKLFIVATEWKGVEANMADGSRTGQILTVPAAAPGVGWP